MADLYGLPSADDEALKSGDPSIGKQILFGLLSSALGTQISAPKGASVAERLAVQKYGDEQTAAQAKAKREAEANAMMEDVAKFDFAASRPQLNPETGVPVAKELPASFAGMGDERMALSKFADYKPVEDFIKERDARVLEQKALAGIGKARSRLGETASPYMLASLDLSEGYARSAPAQSATGAYAPIVNEQETGIKLNEMGAEHNYTEDEKQFQHDLDVRLKQTIPGKAEGDPEGFGGAGVAPNQISGEMQLRKEYTGLSAPYYEVKKAYEKTRDAGQRDTPAADMAIIYGFMKAEDPGSTVRESEFANAARAGSLPEKFGNQVMNILKGTRLSPAMRADFLAQTKNYYDQAEIRQRQIDADYTNLADSYGFDKARIIGSGAVSGSADKIARLKELAKGGNPSAQATLKSMKESW
jgi:hypothetical protein